MNSRSLLIAMVGGLALALFMFGVTVLIGNSMGWLKPTSPSQSSVITK